MIKICLSMFFLEFMLCGTLHVLDVGGYFLSHVRKVFDYNLLKYFLRCFLFLLFWDPPPNNLNVGMFNIVPEVSKTLLISFHSFYSFAVLSTILSSVSCIFIILSQLFCYWFLPGYFSFQLLCCLSLFICSLVFLCPC